ncbi:MAG: tartrate dehydrogenase [Candidatus Latescibacteria bacterium]|nr:tartrate dehydrogenase [Candidatus Latescibacterota bacterium]
MSHYRIAVIPGDGVGPEVIAEGKKVLNTLSDLSCGSFSFEYQEFDWGSNYYRAHGRMMSENGLSQVADADAIFFGAVGDPQIQDHITLNGLILPIRRTFDQYACVRPSYLYPGVTSPLSGKQPGDIDLIVVRENTEGEYANIGGRLYNETDHEVAVQTAIFTRRGTERVIRYAFQLARQRNKKRKVTSVTKSNAQGYGMVFWDEVFRRVAGEFPDIQTESLLVDAACMDFIRRPQDFDVVVASNLFGDILTDIGAIIVGSMGMAPSANMNPERRSPSMFEPVHGSAYDIAGRGIANPLATILSAAMMLDFLGEHEGAQLIHRAVEENLREGRIRTPDLGGQSTTCEVGEDIVRILKVGGL